MSDQRCEAAVDYIVAPSRRWGGAGTVTKWGVRQCSRPAYTERLTDVGIPGSISTRIRVCHQHARSRLLFSWEPADD